MQIIVSTSHSSSFNLAAEEVLFFDRQDDLLFLYINGPSVVIGSNQAIRNEVDLDFCIANDIEIIRRMSGGGAVYHDLGNLNYCFISNKKEGKSALNDDFLKPIVEVLTDFGIPVSVGKRKDLWLQSESKISGTASHVGKTRELHHGTLLYDSKLDLLEKALSAKNVDITIKAISSVRSPVKNIKSFLEEKEFTNLVASDFFKLITEKLANYLHQNILYDLTASESARILLLAQTKYKSLEWTYKK